MDPRNARAIRRKHMTLLKLDLERGQKIRSVLRKLEVKEPEFATRRIFNDLHWRISNRRYVYNGI